MGTFSGDLVVSTYVRRVPMRSRRFVLQVVAVVLALALTLLATACGSSYGDPEPTPQASYVGSLVG